MRTLIFILTFLLTFNSWALPCRQFESVAEYLNTKKFIAASRDYRRLQREPELRLADVNQAKSITYRFPAFEELGFGKPGGEGWKPYHGRLQKSALHGKQVGWEISNSKGHARLRIDWDPQKGAHYNIEITERSSGRPETHKLAVRFECGASPCTEQQVVRMVERMQL